MIDENKYYELVSDRLRSIRQSEGYTQKEVANYTFKDEGSVGIYERGSTKPNIYYIHRFCKLFNLDANWLLSTDYDVAEDILDGIDVDTFKRALKIARVLEVNKELGEDI